MTDKERLFDIKNNSMFGIGHRTVTKEDFLWLIERAEQVQELKKKNMQLNRAMKHIAQFPTWFDYERHSKRALKISRKVLSKHKREESR